MAKFRITIIRTEYYRGDYIVDAKSRMDAKAIAEQKYLEDDDIFEEVAENFHDAETSFLSSAATVEDINNYKQIN